MKNNMRFNSTLVFSMWCLMYFSLSGHCQETYHTTINYEPSGDGVSAEVVFKVQYDTFLNEPTELKGARLLSVKYVQFNGERYYQNDVPEEVWEDIEFGIINVRFDVFDGAYKVSTVTYNNLISFDVKGSPDWGEVFPGVTAEKEKDLFRNGFSMSNARIINANPRFYKLRRYVKDMEKSQEFFDLKSKGLEHIQREEWEQAKSTLKEALSIGRSLETSERRIPNWEKEESEVNELLGEIEASAQKERAWALVEEGDALAESDPKAALELYKQAEGLSPEDQRIKQRVEDTEGKIKSKDANQEKEAEGESESEASTNSNASKTEERNQAEEAARQAEYERQQRVASYHEQKSAQYKANQQTAAELGASAAVVHILIGSLLYGTLGNDHQNSRSIGDSWFGSVYGGYGFSSLPVFTNSSVESYDGINYYYENETTNHNTFTIDLRGGAEFWPHFGKQAGWGANLHFGLGHGILFQNYMFEAGFGLKGFLGEERFKIYGEYSFGSRSFRFSPWIDPYEVGPGGRGNYHYHRVAIGPRVDFESDFMGATTCHLDILPVFEINSNQVSNYGVSPLIFSANRGLNVSLWFENRMKIFMEIFGQYVRTGEVDYDYDIDTRYNGVMFRCGAYRSLDWFGETVYSLSYQNAKRVVRRENRWALHILNPTLNWVPQVDGEIYQNEWMIGVTPVSATKELDMTRFFSAVFGLGFTLSQGGSFNIDPNNPPSQITGIEVGSTLRWKAKFHDIFAPLGLRLYLNPESITKYWAGGGLEFRYMVGGSLEPFDPEDLSFDSPVKFGTQTRRFNSGRYLECGLDFSPGDRVVLRSGIKYTTLSSGLFMDYENFRNKQIALLFAVIL